LHRHVGLAGGGGPEQSQDLVQTGLPRR
jgi:hypothetical protein